ncbi:hypothetical protein [Nocardia sp. NPDC050710]|uniref:hypothetical protein n=1 Tax=Nocardia sp. NPDC050710 TaxID=3157220 RepID=UPI0033F89C79
MSLIDYEFGTDRIRARRTARAALRLARITSPEDLMVAEFMATVFTEYPYDTAVLRLRSAWRQRSPQFRERLDAFMPFGDPHLYRTVVRTDDELACVPDTLDTVTVAPARPWDPQKVPGIRTEEQRERFNDVLTKMIDLLSSYPFPKALTKIADLRKLCDFEDRDHFDACVPVVDPHLYEPADPDLDSRDTIARGIDATEWRIEPVRGRYRPSRLTARVTARIDADRNDPEKYAARRRKAAEHRPTRAAVETPLVTNYFARLLFMDGEAAESKKYDYLAWRAGVYAREPRRIDRSRRRLHRGPTVLDAEVTRAAWDLFYLDYVAAQFDLDSILAGYGPISDDVSHDDAEKRTKIRGRGDVRDRFLANGNDLDYDQAAVAGSTGWPCVSCLIERPVHMDWVAQHRIGGQWRSDDGLCLDCRADGHTGIPALPTGFGPRDMVIARCAYFVDCYPGSADHILERVAKAYKGHPAVPFIRDAITPEFGRPVGIVDLDAPAPKPTRTRQRGPLVGAGQRIDRCGTCFEFKPVHDDGLCTKCRVHLGILTVPPLRQSAVA